METSRTCCCCLLRPPHRDMKTAYRRLHTENTEIYSDILVDCFGIHVMLGNGECGICKVCVRRLRDASDFKLQVQRCQEELQARLDSRLHHIEEPEIKLEISEDDNLKHMLLSNDPIKPEGPDVMGDEDSFSSNKETMAFGHQESPVSAVTSLCEENLWQTYPVKFEHFNDDEAPSDEERQETFSFQPRVATQADQIRTSVNDTQNNIKEKKKRNTRQLQSEKENNMTYALRSVVTFKSERPLNDYRNIHTTGPYTCEICQIVITTKRSMACHMQNHLNPKSEIREKYTWDCDFCNKIFKTKQSMNRHMANIHDQKTLKCDVCFKWFASSMYLNAHKKLHTKRESNYCCDICGKRFYKKFHMFYHKQVHTGEKKYTCDICQKRFRQKKELEEHIHVHLGVKPIACKCGKTFTHMSSYKRHDLYIHKKSTEDRPYLCEICNKRFIRSHHLKKHKLCHTGEKPHCCETCGKLFALKSNLVVHRLTHVNGNTYYCDLCPKMYSTKEGLRQHKRVHSNKKKE